MSALRGSFNFLWDITRPLGQGATSMVYKGRNKNTGEEVAVKVFTTAGNMRPRDVQMREYTVMKKLNHSNIVGLLAIEDEQGTNNKVIIMELSTLGSLYNMLEEPQNSFGLEEEEFLRVVNHVVSGIKHLRENGIAHRDIKPGNILRYKGDDGRSIYKLTDFGAARELEEEEQFMSLYGTEEYLHPDVYERAVLRSPARHKFTAKVDLWSLGVTFYQVATGQLPFKPFGGRKNREKMFEIVRRKESGVISGVQKTEGGEIVWSRSLPVTCRHSSGLKLLVTTLLAGLLETDPKRVWSFDTFFKEVDDIISKVKIDVFCPQTWACLKVYIDAGDKLTQLQEFIAMQTEISSHKQLLIFDGLLLQESVSPMTPITQYSKSISLTNPVFVFSTLAEIGRFPKPIVPEFPRITPSMTLEHDYPLTKMCAALGCFLHKEVDLYNIKQELMRRAVYVNVHELYHECGHLVDYSQHLERNFKTVVCWKDNFMRTVEREREMLKFIPNLNIRDESSELLDFESKTKIQCEEREKEIRKMKDDTKKNLETLQKEQLKDKQLLKSWSDDLGCNKEDRCVSKVGVILESVLRIKNQFQEDRKKASLNFNEEQIHKYDKNKLAEMCTQLRSLLMDHCHSNARKQFEEFQNWHRQALKWRNTRDDIEKEMVNLFEKMEAFIGHLNEICEQYDIYVHKIIRKVKEKSCISQGGHPDLEGSQNPSPDRKHKTSTPQDKKNHRHVKTLIGNLIERMGESRSSLYEVKSEIDNTKSMLESLKNVIQPSQIHEL
ncbi:hypothetical protein CHS0354_029615 [Potamilus streckersoni]|uniref:Protein kinase domain-containing protein n=1 Tax=Potamilus streckersoni TaxID=2493646 RepID=A0AAE0VIQ3_9BIVA|nr:hypothetical protein CHS0354_029615 [Potamilus streckersoni]